MVSDKVRTKWPKGLEKVRVRDVKVKDQKKKVCFHLQQRMGGDVG